MFHRFLIVAIILSQSAFSASAEDIFYYQLHDLDGHLHKASDSRGKWLVINFWATWCAPCLKELLELERFYQQTGRLLNCGA